MSDLTDSTGDDGDLFVRPYVVTAGRTVGAGGDIPLETLIVALQSGDDLPPEHRSVVAICGEALSVAEIAADIDQPLGVARVLVADLAASGHVMLHQTAASENEAIVRRLLDGIRSL